MILLSLKLPPRRELFYAWLYAFILVSGLVALLAFVYMPALPGILQFDDNANLGALQDMASLNDALRWSLEGIAGPAGRPLALITFALQFYQWPIEPAAFLQWNIALHIVNSLVVFWLGMVLAQAGGMSFKRGVLIAWCVALLWGVLPLLNTSVLFVVQRMNLLSSFFVLVGLVAYIKIRVCNHSSPRTQLSALVVLGVFAVLAVLAKENGALIIIYALLVEYFFLQPRNQTTFAERLALMALLALSLGLLAYLLSMIAWGTCSELTRGYGVLDRFAMQGQILLAYLKTAFLPRLAELNPYRFQHLGIGLDKTYLLIGWSLFAGLWLATLAAFFTRWRMLAFALGWFMLGHIMESSWLPLEPYFAHRNYLPMVGLLLGLAFLVFRSANQRSPWIVVGVLYIVLMAVLSSLNTRLWGDAPLAAEMWLKEEPSSNRAALNLAYILEKQSGVGEAQASLDYFVEHGRDSVGLRLQKLITACSLNPYEDHAGLVDDVLKAIKNLPYEGWATDLVEDLDKTLNKQACTGVMQDSIALIAQAFLEKPAYRCSNAIVHNLTSILGLVALRQGHPDLAVDLWIQALSADMAFGVAGLSFEVALESKQNDAAHRIYHLAMNSHIPKGVKPEEWQALLKSMGERLVQQHPTSNAEGS